LSGPTPEFVAHRGESHDAPENTMAAFRLAWERGIRTVELDVRLTADGRLIVCHDADTKRTTGISRLIAETPLAELQTLDAGSYKGPEWAGQRLPTLEEVVAAQPAHGCLWIEVKSGPPTVEVLHQLLGASGLRPDQYAVISFDDEVVRLARQAFPQSKTYLISAFRRGTKRGEWFPPMEELTQRALTIGATGLNLHFIGPVTTRTARLVHENGLELGVWTVDNPVIAKRLIRVGVDTITSNRASWLRDQLCSETEAG